MKAILSARQVCHDRKCQFHGDACEGLNLYADERRNLPEAAIPQMVMDNTDNHETAFTVSIDHKMTTTGISAESEVLRRARAWIRTQSRRISAARGHMFPLMAKKNGILERNGHTRRR